MCLRSPNALPNGSILNGRYLSGCVLSSPSNEFVYSCFDMTLENKLLLHEYAPQGCLRDPADRCSIAFSDSATRYDFQESARAHMERAKALLRVKDHPDQPALTDYFEENNSSYYVTEYREITPDKSAVRPSAPASSQATVMPETTANAAAPASLQHVDYQAGGYGQTSQQAPQGTQTKKLIIAALIAAAALCVIIPLVLHSKKADRRSADTSTSVEQTTPELTGEATPEPTEAVTPDVTESATPLVRSRSTGAIRSTTAFRSISPVTTSPAAMSSPRSIPRTTRRHAPPSAGSSPSPPAKRKTRSWPSRPSRSCTRISA